MNELREASELSERARERAMGEGERKENRKMKSRVRMSNRGKITTTTTTTEKGNRCFSARCWTGLGGDSRRGCGPAGIQFWAKQEEIG